MRLHRFFTTSDLATATEGEIFVISDDTIFHQLSKVLRAKAGDPVEFFDPQGIAIHGELAELKNKKIAVKVRQRRIHQLPQRSTTLYLAMLKRENFELAVQKATEVGISRIVPLITERTIKTGFNRARIEKIAIEAAEQSGRVSVPELHDPKPYIQAIAATHDLKLFLDFNGTEFDGSMTKDKDVIALYVGPEGGWTDNERILAKEAGCRAVSLGAQILRAETAAIIGSYLIA